MLITRLLLTCLCRLWLALLLSAASCAHANTLRLDTDTGKLSLQSQFDMWEDRSGKTGIADILRNENALDFQPLSGNLSAGYTHSAFWLRLDLQRRDQETPVDWLLEMTPVMLDDIRLYEVDEHGQLREHRAGDHLSLAQQEFRHRYPLFQIRLPDNNVHRVYLRVQSTSAVFFRARLWNSKLFIEQSNMLSSMMGVYYGIMLAMIAYNAVLLVSYRDLSLLHYLLLSFSVLVAGMSANGHIGLVLAPETPWLVDIAPAFSSQMVVLASSLFVSSFLTLKTRWPQMYWLFRVIQMLVVIFLISILAGYNHHIAAIAQWVAVVQILAFLPVCLMSGLRGFTPGYIVFAASLAWIAGVSLIPLRNLGVLQPGSLVDYGYQLGSAIEVIMLALAQAYRISLIKKESAAVQQQLLDLAQHAEQELEAKVRQRTTELDQAVQRLQQLDREKNEFLGIAAHDLKNPLTSIIGMSILLRQPQIAAQQQLDYLQRISASGERMMRIITNLLDVNALETGHLHLRLQRLNLGDLLREVVKQYQDMLAAKNLQLHLDISPDIEVNLDPNASTQIIDNLISNAIKFSPQGLSIWLTVDRKNGMGRLTVRDQGQGLSAQDQLHLFEKFTRLSTTPTAGEHSSGLGLSIVKKLSEAQGGRVECLSAVGQGTSFIVAFPLAEKRNPLAAPE